MMTRIAVMPVGARAAGRRPGENPPPRDQNGHPTEFSLSRQREIGSEQVNHGARQGIEVPVEAIPVELARFVRRSVNRVYVAMTDNAGPRDTPAMTDVIAQH